MAGFADPYWGWMQLLGWVQRRKQALADNQPFEAEAAAQPAASLAELLVDAEDKLALDNSQKAILAALKEGRLKARGLKFGKGEPIEISRSQWPAMLIHYQGEGRNNPMIPGPFAGTPHPFRPGAARWEGLQFPREQVLALWPGE